MGHDADDEIDAGPGRPLVSDASVRWICCTALALAAMGLVGLGMAHQPGAAKEILGATGIGVMLAFVITPLWLGLIRSLP